jgi:hypothetical protein
VHGEDLPTHEPYPSGDENWLSHSAPLDADKVTTVVWPEVGKTWGLVALRIRNNQIPKGGSAQFVARYIERGPVSLQKLSLDGEIVTYTTKDGTAHEFDGLEFLARLSSHIPKPYESLTRYYGWYS